MKRISYLDMVKTLLSESDFSSFVSTYTKPITKSIKILNSQGGQATIARLSADGWNLIPPRFSRKGNVYDDVLFVEKTGRESLGSHTLHQEGKFYVQEMAAGMAAQVLYASDGKSQPRGQLVLDLCAAPGGKSIQLADLNCDSVIISNEPDPHRRKALEANLERCGIINTLVTGYDGRQLGDLLFEQCDKVLLDAPCSGEGMQYKKEFTVYQRNEKKVKKLAHLQRELFISAFKALKVGGELVYSTCTTNIIENEENVAYFLQEFAGSLELLPVEIEEKSCGLSGDDTIDGKVARFRPHVHHTGGFFIAKFRKTASLCQYQVSRAGTPSKSLGTAFRRVSPPDFLNTLHFDGGISEKTTVAGIEERYLFLASKHTLRITIPAVIPFLDQLYLQRVGLPIAKILQDGSLKPIVANLPKIRLGTGK